MKNYIDYFKPKKIKKGQDGTLLEKYMYRDLTSGLSDELRQSYDAYIEGGYTPLQALAEILKDVNNSIKNYDALKKDFLSEGGDEDDFTSLSSLKRSNKFLEKTKNKTEDELKEDANKLIKAGNTAASSFGVNADNIGTEKGLMSGKAALATGIAANIGVDALKAVDNATMGDKNFGAQSAAIDSAVHGASKALINSGNPYAMAAGAGLEAANFLTKAGGQTTQGFDVDIKSSGFGDIGHKESSSSRDFGAMIGLGGTNLAKQDAKLAARNEQALMALKAADISDSIAFEQEARMSSVDNTLKNNEIALNGGLDTDLLAAKQGAKLNKKEFPKCLEINFNKVKYAQNGAKLTNIEVSDTPSVIPDGDLHKNKHDDFGLDNITKKGIPVITVKDDSAETLLEIQEQADSVVLHAEVEKEEVIFNKELTDFIEELRKRWHESGEKDNKILLRAGMRLAKELIENTEDNTEVTAKAQSQI